MSGPGLNEGIYNNSRDGRRHYLLEPQQADRLRRLADRVESMGDHDLPPALEPDEHPTLSDEDAVMVANLLRAKADVLDAMRKTLEDQFGHEDVRALMKAVEWTDTGDYGPRKIAEAWADYASKSDTYSEGEP